MMKTVLVKYKVWKDGGHALLDGGWEIKGTIVKVMDLGELNEMFSNIHSVTILEVKGIPILSTDQHLKNIES